MSPELINTIGTIAGVIVAALGAFLFAFWIAMGIWAFHDIRMRTRDWLVIVLAVSLVLIFPLIGLILYLMIRPKATLADVYDRALEEEALLRELEQTQACHSCGVPVKDNWVYCPNCHAQLQHTCPGCGNLARNEWAICVYCGAAQPQAMVQPRVIAVTAPASTPLQPLPQSLPQPSPQAQASTQLPSQTQAAGPTVTSPAPDRTYRNPFRRSTQPPASPTEIDDTTYRPA